jgi:hypothetical protein
VSVILQVLIPGFLTDVQTEEVALEREVEGDIFLQDIGQGLGFRPGSFDGVIRLSLQPNTSCIHLNLNTCTAYLFYNGF